MEEFEEKIYQFVSDNNIKPSLILIGRKQIDAIHKHAINLTNMPNDFTMKEISIMGYKFKVIEQPLEADLCEIYGNERY